MATKKKNQKPLTLSDLGKFTEDVLLPAMKSLIEEELEDKLNPIKQELFSIKEDIKRI